jgi:hypothetical protein
VARLRLGRRLKDVVATEVAGATAVTFAVLPVRGTIAGDEVGGRMRHKRTWVLDAGPWRVFAAHIGPAAP